MGYTRINSGNFNLSFKIENTGSGNLILSGSPTIALGGDINNYGILQPSNSIISSTATFFNLIKRFSSVGLKTSTISIPNDDCDENPYTVTFSGIGFSDTKVADTSSWSARRDHVLLNYNNTLWILGGTSSGVTKDVYSSNDGLTWSTKTLNAAWGKRTNFSGEVFNGKMWVLGGSEDTGSSVYVGRNDVWNSTDGITWTQVTTNGGWTARTFFATATFNNKIWIFGGKSSNGPMLNDVWYSSDGITWTQATANAGWEPRDSHKVLVHNNKLWLIGGFGGVAIGKYQDVWSSPDGITWSKITSNANFSTSGLSSHNAVAFNNKMWVINGFNNTAVQNYIFQSSDGIQWERIEPLWTPRDTSASTVFNGKIWMLGGFDYNANRLNDIWTFWDL
ncbi:Kelch repeat-containing protein [Leptospira kirschneri]|uniref:Kelch repeat-containing protein n=1 Tax=Leptospira kirschneri TaxID=29507 RepID=UPI00398B00C6